MGSDSRGIRAIAIVEAVKGLVVLLAGFGALSLVHHNVQAVAEILVRRSHLNPSSHYPRIFVETAGNLHDSQLWLFAVGALAYSLVRFVEAYGLWRERRWAEWFAAGSGAIYLPIELYELFRGVTWIKLAVVLVNAVVVSYMVWILARRRGRSLQ